MISPSTQLSSMEQMLEVIKRREDLPKDLPPALPLRPTSKARLPSAVKTRKTMASQFNRRIGDAAEYDQTRTPSIGLDSMHLQGVLMDKEGKSLANVIAADRETLGDNANGGLNNLTADNRFVVKASGYNNSLGLVCSGLPEESKKKEKPELIVTSPELLGDSSNGKSGVTRSQERGPIESPYKRKLESENTLEERLTESEDSDFSSPAVSIEQGDGRWKSDSVSGLKKTFI